MERLTFRGHKGQAILRGTACNYSGISYDCQLDEGVDLLKVALEKLANYEDTEEQGLLLKLPIPIGKPIYKVVYAPEINDGFVYETVMSLKFYADNIKDFENEIVYTTKSEAEQALAEMKEVSEYGI